MPTRREFLSSVAAGAAAATLQPSGARAQTSEPVTAPRPVGGAPLNSGYLAGKNRYNDSPGVPDRIGKRGDRIRRIAQQHGTGLRIAALQFCNAPDDVSAVIPGASSGQQVIENALSPVRCDRTVRYRTSLPQKKHGVGGDRRPECDRSIEGNRTRKRGRFHSDQLPLQSNVQRPSESGRCRWG